MLTSSKIPHTSIICRADKLMFLYFQFNTTVESHSAVLILALCDTLCDTMFAVGKKKKCCETHKTCS